MAKMKGFAWQIRLEFEASNQFFSGASVLGVKTNKL